MVVTILILLSFFLAIIIVYQYIIAPKINPLNKATSFEDQNMLSEAIVEYKKVLDDNPNDFVVHYRLANIHFKLKEFDQSALHLEHIVEINQYNYEVEKLDVQKKLVEIYLYRGETAEVFRNYIDILRFYPGDLEALYHVAFISLGQEEFEISQRYFDKLAKLKDSDFDIQFGAGICSYQNQKLNEAVEYFKKAVSIKRDSEIANIAIAFALRKQKDFKQAIVHVTRLLDLEIQPEVRFIALRLHAFLNIQLKRYNDTVSIFEEMLNHVKKNTMEEEILITYYDIGYACIMAERSKDAYEYWSELYQLDKSFHNIDFLVTLLRKEMDVDYKKMKDDFEISIYDSTDEWVTDSFPSNYLWRICGLRSSEDIDIKNVMVFTRARGEKEDLPRSSGITVDHSELIARFCELDTERFRIISNRVVSKLNYKVDQILQTYREKDGVDFLAISLDDKKPVLISVRRWVKTKVSDIPLRNFAQEINDMKVNGGLFISTTELTAPAIDSLKNLSKVKVVEPEELGELLVGLV